MQCITSEFIFQGTRRKRRKPDTQLSVRTCLYGADLAGLITRRLRPLPLSIIQSSSPVGVVCCWWGREVNQSSRLYWDPASWASGLYRWLPLRKSTDVTNQFIHQRQSKYDCNNHISTVLHHNLYGNVNLCTILFLQWLWYLIVSVKNSHLLQMSSEY